MDLTAWAAGLYEGEGSVYVQTQNKQRPIIHVVLVMTDEDVVRKFCEAVEDGSVYGPYQPKGNRKPYWRWQVWRWDQAERIFQMFREYLGKRRTEQFERCLSQKPAPKPTSPECGRSEPDAVSSYGHVLHWKRGEPSCESCRAAHSRYMKQYRKRRLKNGTWGKRIRAE